MSEANLGIKTLDDLNVLLDTELSDLADLPELKVPPVGRYTLCVATKTKDDGEHPQVVIEYSVVEVGELADPDETPPNVDDKFFVNYNIDNEYGLGKLKKDLAAFGTALCITKIGELLTAMDGLVVKGTVKRREDKKNLDDDGKPRVYGTVVGVEVL